MHRTFATVPGLILLYRLTDVLAVPAAVAGAAVFLPKAWDALINPLADTLADDVARTGKRRAATFTGLWTAAETLAFALGAGAFALVLAVTGFRSSDAGHRVAKPEAALTGIALGMSVLPAVPAAASLWLLHLYRAPLKDRALLRTEPD